MAIAGTILGRLLKAALTLFAIAVLNFFLIHAAPGDPAAVLAGSVWISRSMCSFTAMSAIS